jgi:hypothetical protein
LHVLIDILLEFEDVDFDKHEDFVLDEHQDHDDIIFVEYVFYVDEDHLDGQLYLDNKLLDDKFLDDKLLD